MTRLEEKFNRYYESLLLEYNQKQIQDFKNKYGDDTYDYFIKSQQRLKNAGYTTDIDTYISNKWDSQSFKDLLDKLDSEVSTKRGRYSTKQLKQEWQPEGKYNYFGQIDGFDVYQPLNVKASMSMGVNTGWCTSGRYNHSGHPDFVPSENDAYKHWSEYVGNGVQFIYLLDPETHYGKYAIAIYPEELVVDPIDVDYPMYDYAEYNEETDEDEWDEDLRIMTNYELYNAKDNQVLPCDSEFNENLIQAVSKKINIPLTFEIGYPETDIQGNTLVKFRVTSDKYEVPNNITIIGQEAFAGNQYIQDIILPDNLQQIKVWAFKDCTGLKQINLPDSIKIIESGAFRNCISLESIHIPKALNMIQGHVFANCRSLKEVEIPDNIRVLDSGAFQNCRSLEYIKLPELKSIANGTFYYCTALKEIDIPKTIDIINASTFETCTSLEKVHIPEGITRINMAAFAGCKALKKIYIPDSVEYIDMSVFQGCTNLAYVSISKHTEVHPRAFDGSNSNLNIDYRE